MANEISVYSFEKNFLSALETVLTIAGVQTVGFGDADNHKTPRIEISFSYGGADPLDRSRTSAGVQYLRKHTATIELRIYGQTKAEHLDLVGEVRNEMSYNVPTLIQPTLPFYQVQSLYEQGGSSDNGEEEEDFEIGTTLSYSVVFHIPPTAFGEDNGIYFSTEAVYFDGDQLLYGG